MSKSKKPSPHAAHIRVTSRDSFGVGLLSDLHLIQNANQAHAELIAAEPQSEWQASCFAALYIFTEEMGLRGLRKDSFRMLAITS